MMCRGFTACQNLWVILHLLQEKRKKKKMREKFETGYKPEFVFWMKTDVPLLITAVYS